MEENKKVVDSEKEVSSSSFTSQLFAEKGASTGILSSIFPPQSQVPGRNSSTSELLASLQKHTKVEEWNKEIPDEMGQDMEGKKPYTPSRQQTCPLSSSLYYGGQEDMYIQTSSTLPYLSHATFNKNGEDDPSSNIPSAPTGNLWEGSFYY